MWLAGGEDRLLFSAGCSGRLLWRCRLAVHTRQLSSASLPCPLWKSRELTGSDSLTLLVQRIKTHSGHLKDELFIERINAEAKKPSLSPLTKSKGNRGENLPGRFPKEEELYYRDAMRVVQKWTVSCSGSEQDQHSHQWNGGSLAQRLPS